MASYTIEISDAEEKALLTDMITVEAWLNNAIHNKARQCIDKIVLEYSDKNPAKITDPEKDDIVLHAAVKPLAEITAELENEMSGD